MQLFIALLSLLGQLELSMLLCPAVHGAETFRSEGAGTVIVTSTADSGAGSLRQALADANDGDTIQFDPALNGQTILLTSGQLAINKNIILSGPGPDALTISRDPNIAWLRILAVKPGHTATIEGLTISKGHTGGEPGAGILVEEGATLTINNCIVSENFADGGAGGGGIYNFSTLTITNSTVKLNVSGFTFGNPTGDGGGIITGKTLTIINSTISDNTAHFRGAGILGGGTITIINSTISGNWVGQDFAGMGSGGGIFYGGPGTLTIVNSTISRNKASAVGAGIYNLDGTIAIANSTISGNSAYGAIGDAGAVYTTAALMITNSTISENSSSGTRGSISISGDSGLLDIGNTILKAGTSGANIFHNGGTVTSHGYNLSSDNGGGFLTATGDQINTDPILGPLQDNGGPTLTQVPLPGSPAIDAGDPNFTPPPSFDQRGYARVFNGRIDIGSLEVQPTPTPGPTPTATPTPAPVAAQPLNISTRLRVELGDNVMIGGFIITGTQPKKIAVRGIGPSLASSGISDVLADPTLKLRDGSGALLADNDDWQDDPKQAAQLNALGLAPQDAKESGIVATLQPGAAYTVILQGTNGGTGVGLVEVYDTDLAANSQLANISTRGFVQTGDNVMIGGFILGGNNASTDIVVRGIGPSLSQTGLNNALADPTLELRDSNGVLLVANDNWQDDPVSAAQLMAHSLAPQDPLESGIFATLAPSAFTAILAGNNGGTGIGLVEIYNVQ